MGDKEKMEDKSKATKKAPVKTEAKKAPVKTEAKKAPVKTEAKKAPVKTEAKKAEAVTKKIERTVTGKVVSNKMDKTITVLVERKVKHPLYGKYINQSNKFHAHDEKNVINEGDVVQITEHKPISKSKSWVVTKVVSKAQG
jgi:small subunit ribosomal protein S17